MPGRCSVGKWKDCCKPFLPNSDIKMTQLVTSSIIQALSFTGTSYMFKLLEPDKYGAEMKRYHNTLIKLQADKEKFLEEQTKRRDQLDKLKRELAIANQDEQYTNNALAALRQFQRTSPPEEPPLLQNYDEPSDSIKKYNTIAVVLLALLFGGIIVGGYWYFFK